MTDRYLAADPAQRRTARDIYGSIAALPIVSPHGHVDPRLLADPAATFGTPAELFVIRDHYVLRLLHAQGIAYESLGIPPGRARGRPRGRGPPETDHRRIWQLFADHQHLFRATPTAAWLAMELAEVFGIAEPLGSANAQRVYDEIEAKLAHARVPTACPLRALRYRDALHDR